MSAQTATIRINRGIIALPDKWASELEGQDAAVLKVDKFLAIIPKDDYDFYTDEQIQGWREDDTLDSQTKSTLDRLLGNT